MKHFYIFLFIFLFLSSSVKAENPLLKGAQLKKEQGILILHLKGGPFKRGYQQGYLLRKYIKNLYQDYFLKVDHKKTFSSGIH